MVHPDHDCEDCGKTHFAWSLHKEWADKNRKTRNVLIIITVISIALFPVSITVFDLIKTPSSLRSDIDFGLIDAGYNLVCVYDYGVQYCIIRSDETTHLKYNSEKLVLQAKQYPCLNINLRTPEKQVDMFLVTNSTNCVPSLDFPIEDNWSWYDFGAVPNAKPADVFYVVEKTKQWWDISNCPEAFNVYDLFTVKELCNWWLKF